MLVYQRGNHASEATQLVLSFCRALQRCAAGVAGVASARPSGSHCAVTAEP